MALVDLETPYPKRGFAKLRDSGDLVVERYRHKDYLICLEPDEAGRHWEWNCKTEPSPATAFR